MPLLLLALALFLSSPVMADPGIKFPNDYTGFYLGGGAAFSNVLATDGDSTTSWERGDTDYGWVVNAGYRFSPFIAVELGYLDGGKPEFNDRGFNGDRAETEIDLTAVQFSGIGTLPFGDRWELYLKLGLSAWDADSDQVLTPAGGVPQFRQEDGSGPALLVGVGIGATLFKNLYARLEYQSFRIDDELLALDAINTSQDDASFDAVNLEFHYRFGGEKKPEPINEPPPR